MKNRYLRLLPLLAFGALATACAPTYRLAVQPAAPGTLFSSELPQAQALADSVSLRLDFASFEPGWLVFHADYRNDSRRPVVIEPTGFSYAPGRAQTELAAASRVPAGQLVPAATAAAGQHLAWPALPTAALPALNPDPSIEALQGEANRQAARANRTDWLGIALLVVAVGADVASATHGRESVGQVQQRAALHELVWTYQAVSAANKLRHAVMADNLSRQAVQLSDFALRRVTLLPGQQVHGYVYLPRFDTADALRVYAPVGQQQVALEFVQTHRRR